MKESEKKFIVPIILFLIGILLHVLSLANWATAEVKKADIIDTGNGGKVEISSNIDKYGVCSMRTAQVRICITDKNGKHVRSEYVSGVTSFRYVDILLYVQLEGVRPFTVEAEIVRTDFRDEKLRKWSYVFLCSGLTIGTLIYLKNRNKIVS